MIAALLGRRAELRTRVRARRPGSLDAGFTHMEWFRRDDGSLAIGEIAARPPTPSIDFIIVRHPDTEVVTAAVKTIIETIGVEYG